MNREAGFSVAEVIATLLVLSLATVALSEAVSSVTGSWQRIRDSIDRKDNARSLLMDIASVQSQDDEHNLDLTLDVDEDLSLVLARPRVQRDASCRFDLVARQCR